MKKAYLGIDAHKEQNTSAIALAGSDFLPQLNPRSEDALNMEDRRAVPR
ncbi:MAG: hypothetical protein PHI93_07940 [Kiritimatiellae bacterium]|jgi:hypothetical protein|nr:hypothetical protein [Kiritimatiellia bacterium]